MLGKLFRSPRHLCALLLATLGFFLVSCSDAPRPFTNTFGGGGGGSNTVRPPTPATTLGTIQDLRVYPNATSFRLTWTNPTRNDMVSMQIEWKAYESSAPDAVQFESLGGARIDNSTARIASGSPQTFIITNGENAILGLDPKRFYDFFIHVSIRNATTGEIVQLQPVSVPRGQSRFRRALGANRDSDEWADFQDLCPDTHLFRAPRTGNRIDILTAADNDGDGCYEGEDASEDALPNNPNEHVDNDGDGIGSNTDPDDNDNTTISYVVSNPRIIRVAPDGSNVTLAWTNPAVDSLAFIITYTVTPPTPPQEWRLRVDEDDRINLTANAMNTYTVRTPADGSYRFSITPVIAPAVTVDGDRGRPAGMRPTNSTEASLPNGGGGGLDVRSPSRGRVAVAHLNATLSDGSASVALEWINPNATLDGFYVQYINSADLLLRALPRIDAPDANTARMAEANHSVDVSQFPAGSYTFYLTPVLSATEVNRSGAIALARHNPDPLVLDFISPTGLRAVADGADLILIWQNPRQVGAAYNISNFALSYRIGDVVQASLMVAGSNRDLGASSFHRINGAGLVGGVYDFTLRPNLSPAAAAARAREATLAGQRIFKVPPITDITVTGRDVTLTWTPLSDSTVAGYTIEYREANAEAAGIVELLGANRRSHTASNLPNGNYVFSVTPKLTTPGSANRLALATVVAQSIPPQPPVRVTNVTAVVVTDTGYINVTWNNPVNVDILGVHIDYIIRNGVNCPSDPDRITLEPGDPPITLTAGASNFYVHMPECDGTYVFTITPILAPGSGRTPIPVGDPTGGDDNTVTVGGGGPPVVVTDITVTADAFGNVTVSWINPANVDILGVHIDYTVNGGADCPSGANSITLMPGVPPIKLGRGERNSYSITKECDGDYVFFITAILPDGSDSETPPTGGIPDTNVTVEVTIPRIKVGGPDTSDPTNNPNGAPTVEFDIATGNVTVEWSYPQAVMDGEDNITDLKIGYVPSGGGRFTEITLSDFYTGDITDITQWNLTSDQIDNGNYTFYVTTVVPLNSTKPPGLAIALPDPFLLDLPRVVGLRTSVVRNNVFLSWRNPRAMTTDGISLAIDNFTVSYTDPDGAMETLNASAVPTANDIRVSFAHTNRSNGQHNYTVAPNFSDPTLAAIPVSVSVEVDYNPVSVTDVTFTTDGLGNISTSWTNPDEDILGVDIEYTVDNLPNGRFLVELREDARLGGTLNPLINLTAGAMNTYTFAPPSNDVYRLYSITPILKPNSDGDGEPVTGPEIDPPGGGGPGGGTNVTIDIDDDTRIRVGGPATDPDDPDNPKGAPTAVVNLATGDITVTWSYPAGVPLDGSPGAITDIIVSYLPAAGGVFTQIPIPAAAERTSTVIDDPGNGAYNITVATIVVPGGRPPGLATAVPSPTLVDLPRVGGLQASVAGNEVTLSWVNPMNYTIDDIEVTFSGRRGAGTLTDINPSTASGVPVSVSHTNNLNGIYTYTVTPSFRDPVVTPISETVEVTVDDSAAVPAVTPGTLPTSVSVGDLSASVAGSEITLNWANPVLEPGWTITGYQVEYDIAGNPAARRQFMAMGREVSLGGNRRGVSLDVRSRYSFTATADGTYTIYVTPLFADPSQRGTAVATRAQVPAPGSGVTAIDRIVVRELVARVSATGDGDDVVLEWVNPNGVALDGFRIEYVLSGDGRVQPVSNNFVGTEESFTVMDLADGVYSFYVTPILSASASGVAGSTQAEPAMLPVGVIQVGNLRARGDGANIILSWDAPLEPAGTQVAVASYKLEYTTVDNTTRRSDGLPGSIVSPVTIAGFAANRYTFYVTPVLASGDDRATLEARTTLAYTPPAIGVDDLRADALSNGVQLTWRNPANLALSGFRIEYNATLMIDGREIKTAPTLASSAGVSEESGGMAEVTVGGLVNGFYSFSVEPLTAENGRPTKAETETVDFTREVLDSAAVSDLRAENMTDSSVNVSWKNPDVDDLNEIRIEYNMSGEPFVFRTVIFNELNGLDATRNATNWLRVFPLANGDYSFRVTPSFNSTREGLARAVHGTNVNVNRIPLARLDLSASISGSDDPYGTVSSSWYNPKFPLYDYEYVDAIVLEYRSGDGRIISIPRDEFNINPLPGGEPFTYTVPMTNPPIRISFNQHRVSGLPGGVYTFYAAPVFDQSVNPGLFGRFITATVNINITEVDNFAAEATGANVELSWDRITDINDTPLTAGEIMLSYLRNGAAVAGSGQTLAIGATTSSYTNLPNGDYVFRITPPLGPNSHRRVVASEEISIDETVKVADLTAVASDDTVTLRWTAPTTPSANLSDGSNADINLGDYTIHYSRAPSSSRIEAANSPAPAGATSFDITGLADGTYTFYVTPILTGANADARRAEVASRSVEVGGGGLTAGSTIGVNRLEAYVLDNDILVRWDPLPADIVESYRITWRTGAASDSARIPGTLNSRLIPNLDDKNYNITVTPTFTTASRITGKAEELLNVNVRPTGVTNLRAENTGGNEITLNWDNPTNLDQDNIAFLTITRADDRFLGARPRVTTSQTVRVPFYRGFTSYPFRDLATDRSHRFTVTPIFRNEDAGRQPLTRETTGNLGVLTASEVSYRNIPSENTIELTWTNPSVALNSISLVYRNSTFTGVVNQLDPQSGTPGELIEGGRTHKVKIPPLRCGTFFFTLVPYVQDNSRVVAYGIPEPITIGCDAPPFRVLNLRAESDNGAGGRGGVRLLWDNPRYSERLRYFQINYTNSQGVEQKLDSRSLARIGDIQATSRSTRLGVGVIIPHLSDGTYRFSVLPLLQDPARATEPGTTDTLFPLTRTDGRGADQDEDTVADAFDVDANGNGLVEINSAVELNSIRTSANLLREFGKHDGRRDPFIGCPLVEDTGGCQGYELTQDLDLSPMAPWQPIGRCSITREDILDLCGGSGSGFNGIFEGNGNDITGLIINDNSQDSVGLFSYLAGNAEVQNLNIIGANLTASSADKRRNVGVLAGYAGSRDGGVEANTSIINVTVRDSSINYPNADAVGGLVGRVIGADILSSYVLGTNVSGGSQVGGLVGRLAARGAAPLSRASIIGSFASADILSAAGSKLGGLVGEAAGVDIAMSYALSGSIGSAATNETGGLIGKLLPLVNPQNMALIIDIDNRINASYALATSISGDTKVAGLIGNISEASDIMTEISYSYSVVNQLMGMRNVSGLLDNDFTGRVVNSYWNASNFAASSDSKGVHRDLADLRSPTTADSSGTYVGWSSFNCLDLGQALFPNIGQYISLPADPPWDFGTASQLPALDCRPATRLIDGMAPLIWQRTRAAELLP